MGLTPDNEVPLPENIQAYVNTTLAWDNIDRLEDTLSGAGTSHQVKMALLSKQGILVQTSLWPLELSKLGQGKEALILQ